MTQPLMMSLFLAMASSFAHAQALGPVGSSRQTTTLVEETFELNPTGVAIGYRRNNPVDKAEGYSKRVTLSIELFSKDFCIERGYEKGSPIYSKKKYTELEGSKIEFMMFPSTYREKIHSTPTIAALEMSSNPSELVPTINKNSSRIDYYKRSATLPALVAEKSIGAFIGTSYKKSLDVYFLERIKCTNTRISKAMDLDKENSAISFPEPSTAGSR